MTLFGLVGRSEGLSLYDGLGGELVAEDPVEGVGEGGSDSETPRSRMSRSTARINSQRSPAVCRRDGP